MTNNNETALFEGCYRNGFNLNPLSRIYERASLVPAAAVIPALKAYIAIAAVKKLVVGSEPMDAVSLRRVQSFSVTHCNVRQFRLFVLAELL